MLECSSPSCYLSLLLCAKLIYKLLTSDTCDSILPLTWAILWTLNSHWTSSCYCNVAGRECQGKNLGLSTSPEFRNVIFVLSVALAHTCIACGRVIHATNIIFLPEKNGGVMWSPVGIWSNLWRKIPQFYWFPCFLLTHFLLLLMSDTMDSSRRLLRTIIFAILIITIRSPACALNFNVKSFTRIKFQ